VDSSNITAPLAFFAGSLSFLSPCVLPLVPVYLGYLSGTALVDEERPNRWHVFTHALFFVMGFTLVFTLLFGLPATLLGEALNQYSTWIARVGGVLVIIFGLHTYGLITIPFLNMTKHLDVKHDEAPGYVRSALIGIAFAAGWTPCIGPLLGAVMSLAFTQPSAGVYFTLVYAAGLAIPFLLTALLLTQATNFLYRLNKHAHVVQRVSGVFLVVIGSMLLLDKFASLNALFIKITPDWMVDHL